MKRIWIAAALLLLIAVTAAFQFIYITNTADRYAGMLDEAEQQMAENDLAKAASTVERLEHRLDGSEWIFDFFLFHSEVSEIHLNLLMLKSYAATGEVREFLALSEKTKHELVAMKMGEYPSFENIF